MDIFENQPLNPESELTEDGEIILTDSADAPVETGLLDDTELSEDSLTSEEISPIPVSGAEGLSIPENSDKVATEPSEAPAETEEVPESSPDAPSDTEGTDPAAIIPETDEPVKSRFKPILLGVLAALAVLFAIGLVLLWRALDVYEQNLPSNVIGQYLETITEDDWSVLVSSRLHGSVSAYEDEISLVKEIVDSIEKSRIKYVQIPSAEEDLARYRVLFDGRELLTVDLESKEQSAFGIHVWEIEKVEQHPDHLPVQGAKLYQWTVPAEAKMTINGIPVTPASLYSSGDLLREISPFETYLPYYTVTYQAVLFHEPEITVSYQGQPLSSDGHGYFARTDLSWLNGITLSVPSVFSVKVNDVPLTEEYRISSSPAEKHPYEAEAAYETVTYRLPPLIELPIIELLADDRSYEPRYSEKNGVPFYELEYPEERLHTVILQVPAGSQVTCNGCLLGAEVCSARSVPDPSLEALAKFLSSVPAVDTYEIRGLHARPQIQVVSEGKNLRVIDAYSSLSTEYVHYLEAGKEPDLLLEYQLQPIAANFGKEYIHFNTQGARNLKANQEKILSYSIKGSPFYKMVTASYIQMIYMDTWSVNYLKYDISDIILHSEDAFSCNLHFSIEKKLKYWSSSAHDYVTVTEVETGIFHAVFIRQKDEWKAVSLTYKLTEQ